jgi:hypothetical protein
MAAKKPKVDQQDRFDKQDVNLFDVLLAIDNKQYDYYQKLTPEQQKKLVFFNLIQWTSAIKSNNRDLQSYYLQSTEHFANKYFLDHMIASKEHDHSELQWLMLCAASPGMGKQFHQWIPKIGERVSLLKEPAKLTDTKEYFKKIYPQASDTDINMIAQAFVDEHKKKTQLAKFFPTMKLDEIELLSSLVGDHDIVQYEKDSGN